VLELTVLAVSPSDAGGAADPGVGGCCICGCRSPAVAQQQQSDAPSAAECQEMFKAADINNDGNLSRDELASSKDLREFYQADENITSVPQSNFCQIAQADVITRSARSPRFVRGFRSVLHLKIIRYRIE
jgi:hypothetical protein